MAETVWVLTEERPKKDVVTKILEKLFKDRGIAAFFDSLRIIPILDDKGIFQSKYEVLGVKSPAIKDIFLRVVSGKSSFVDYLIYVQDTEPNPGERPLYAIEETKTDDSESRNTGVYQRATKFVYVEVFYPGIDKSMLYNFQIDQAESSTHTNVFGSRCLKTLGVNFMGKVEVDAAKEPFRSVEELIEVKARMPLPPASNVPILIEKVSEDLITVSGRLWKAGGLAHDPNIGALSLICATLRALGWAKRIMITRHGLSQSMVNPGNKFVQIANHHALELEGITIPAAVFPDTYWKYESSGEKLGTIFTHLLVEEFSQGFSIYENHAGCERGYFFTSEGLPVTVSKRMIDSNGNMPSNSPKIELPDLVLIDMQRLEVLNIEGERSQNVLAGIAQIGTFDNFEAAYIARHYPRYEIKRSVVLYGGSDERIAHIEVSLLLNDQGKVILGVKAPSLFLESVKNMTDYWRQ
jgi:hypothetical protein